MTPEDIMPALSQTYVDMQASDTTASSITTPSHLTDSELAKLYKFGRIVGAGNWGQVYEAHERSAKGSRVAVKMVHRTKTSTSNIRVKALWAEFK
jgi:hypothetical protein